MGGKLTAPKTNYTPKFYEFFGKEPPNFKPKFVEFASKNRKTELVHNNSHGRSSVYAILQDEDSQPISCEEPTTKDEYITQQQHCIDSYFIDNEIMERLGSDMSKTRHYECLSPLGERKDFVCGMLFHDKDCFASTASVETPDGMVAMDKLRVGDLVRTSPTTFERVTHWLHRNESCAQQFIVMGLSTEKTLAVTGSHNVFTEAGEAVFARDIVVGDALGGGAVVMSIETIESTGFYCPLTESGELFVDGVRCSCFARAPHAFYKTVLDNLGQSVLEKLSQHGDTMDLGTYLVTEPTDFSDIGSVVMAAASHINNGYAKLTQQGEGLLMGANLLVAARS